MNIAEFRNMAPSAWGLGVVLTTARLKNWPCYETDNMYLGTGLILWYELSNGKGT
jgi:hypothetical protein